MNRERVQMLRDMMEGIPESRINLSEFTNRRNNPHDCQTIACIGGWAGMYPPFKEQGFVTENDGLPHLEGVVGIYACIVFFEADSKTFFRRLPHETGTDKQIALRRLDALLK